jgi:hypothetical protein
MFIRYFLFLTGFIFFFYSSALDVHAQSVCDVSVTTTGVSCSGESNGTAKVVVNGQAPGNPQGCLPGDAASGSYTTGCTVTYSENTGEVLVGPGEQVCLTAGNFTGGIQATGGTLVISGSAKPSYLNLNSSNPGFTLVILSGAAAEFSSLNFCALVGKVARRRGCAFSANHQMLYDVKYKCKEQACIKPALLLWCVCVIRKYLFGVR